MKKRIAAKVLKELKENPTGGKPTNAEVTELVKYEMGPFLTSFLWWVIPKIVSIILTKWGEDDSTE